MFQKVNAYRQSRGLSALTIHSRITEQARIHSQNMAAGTVSFGHDGFSNRVQIISQTLSFGGAGEIVASNWGYSDPASTAVNGWLNSAPHLANIVGNFQLTGIGVAKSRNGEYFFTEIFWHQ
ncbi:MAG: CAP domain-containing protein [Chromatiales bacterium]|nr:CAP domain-containing protein [Chromatiales bacterium]